MGMQALIRAIYPPTCIGCTALVAQEHGLCADCWQEMPFITGLVCESCGTPLPGTTDPMGPAGGAACDDCLRHPPPWHRGRAVACYGGLARQLVLQLKHGDRHDLARPLGDWLARAARPLLQPDTLIAPVPLHRWRLVRRRANQAALLAARVARRIGRPQIPDLLQRTRATPGQDHRSHAERHANLAGALRPHPRHAARIAGRHLLLVDDVMTSGATLAAATGALLAAGAGEVFVQVLARVGKDA